MHAEEGTQSRSRTGRCWATYGIATRLVAVPTTTEDPGSLAQGRRAQGQPRSPRLGPGVCACLHWGGPGVVLRIRSLIVR